MSVLRHGTPLHSVRAQLCVKHLQVAGSRGTHFNKFCMLQNTTRTVIGRCTVRMRKKELCGAGGTAKADYVINVSSMG